MDKHIHIHVQRKGRGLGNNISTFPIPTEIYISVAN